MLKPILVESTSRDLFEDKLSTVLNSRDVKDIYFSTCYSEGGGHVTRSALVITYEPGKISGGDWVNDEDESLAAEWGF